MSSKSELQALSERDRISSVSHIFTTAFLLQLSNGSHFSVNAVLVPDPGYPYPNKSSTKRAIKGSLSHLSSEYTRSRFITGSLVTLVVARWFFCPKILGGARDLRIILFFKSACILSSGDNVRWWGNPNPLHNNLVH